MKNLGERIKKFRNKIGLTQQELSEKIGKSVNTVKKYESGYTTPPTEVLLHLSSIFHVSLYTLTSDENFDREIFQVAFNLASDNMTSESHDVFMSLGWYSDYDMLLDFYNHFRSHLPKESIKGLLAYIADISKDDFNRIYTDLIQSNVYDLDSDIEHHCKNLYLEISNASENNQNEAINIRTNALFIKFLNSDKYPTDKLNTELIDYLYDRVTDALEFEFYKLEKNNYKVPASKK
ncbi:MAG: helix-turn-helix domain-containing protein [Clostridiaceae bacterium]